jgi:hypothetical protein
LPEDRHELNTQPARTGPIDSLRRGLRSLRANWQLVPVLAAQLVLTIGLMLAGFFVLLTALGVSVVAWVRDLGPGWPQQLAEDLVASLEAAPPALLPLVVPLIAATLVWTLAFGLYCYLQGGVVGVLAEGEMAAGAGLPGWRSFRRFSMAGFDLQGRLLFWRYFWLNHLLGAVALVWMLLVLALVALVVPLAAGPNTSVGVAIGCVGLVPLGLLLFAVALWSMLATVEVARPGTGVWAASRRALGTLRRRLGAVLLIWLLALSGWIAVGAALVPLRWAVAIAARDQISLWLGGRGMLMLAETVVNGALIVALIATLAALVGLRPAVEAEAGR